MATAALLAILLMAGHAAWRRDPLAPPAFSLFVCAASAVAFQAIALFGWRPGSMLTWWQVAGEYRPVGVPVMLFYLGLASLSYVAMLATGTGTGTGTPPRARHGDPAAGWLSEALVSRPAVALYLVLLVLCGVHAFAIDWSPLLRSAVHLEARSPRGVGLSPGVLAIFHRNLPMLGCLLGPVAALALHAKGNRAAAGLPAIAFLYAALIACGIGTRFFVLQFACVAATLFVLRARGLAPLAAAVTLLAYLVTIATRRSKEFGLLAEWDMLRRGDILPADLLPYVGASVFGGGFSLAEAMLRGTADHPTAYKWLSFSPLPSAIDGYASLRGEAERVFARAPFSGFAESYFFGPGFLSLHLVLLLAGLLALGWFWRRHRGAAAIVPMAPAYYALAAMHLYPLRNTLRWLVLAVLASMAFELLLAWRRTPRAAVTFVGTLPPPVTGRTLATRCVVDALASATSVRMIDLSSGDAGASVPFRVGKLARTLRAMLVLLLGPAPRGASLYLVANHAAGLWYDAAFVAIARLRGYRVFLHHQVYRYVARRDPRMALIHALMRETDTHVVLTEDMWRDFANRYPRPRRHLVVSNSIVTLREPRPSPREPATDTLRLGMLGNLTIEKGLPEALDTVERLRRAKPDATLLLAGPLVGEAVAGLATQASGDAVEWRPAVYGDKKREFFEQIDVLLMPTRYANEAEPLVIAEALHHGVPVIAYARGCIAEQVGDAGLVIPPEEDFAKHAAAWCELADLELYRRRASQRASELRALSARQLASLVEAMATPSTFPTPTPAMEPA